MNRGSKTQNTIVLSGSANPKIFFRSGIARCGKSRADDYVRKLYVLCPEASLCSCKVVETEGGLAADQLQFQFNPKRDLLVFQAPEIHLSGVGHFVVSVSKPGCESIVFALCPSPKQRKSTPPYKLEFKPLSTSATIPPTVSATPIPTAIPTTVSATPIPVAPRSIVPSSTLSSVLSKASPTPFSSSMSKAIAPAVTTTTSTQTSESSLVRNGVKIRVIKTIITTITEISE